MTIIELIDKLMQYPPTTPVVVYASGKPFSVEHVTDACVYEDGSVDRSVVVVLSERKLFDIEMKD